MRVAGETIVLGVVVVVGLVVEEVCVGEEERLGAGASGGHLHRGHGRLKLSSLCCLFEKDLN